ncbi:MAG: 16S rRNA (guanine(966)-N(2))-methyltransferase RsmD [Polyangiaceae bacterium]|nr:16S rRNA (guanine(966)-N(2))-methyltransferase RsmD [Polyangiaceae bacterium]
MRVIAGALGGRTLVAPRGMSTRPTTDRVREALFSALASVHNARVLDVYAGTGALGIEALSRGASHATFVENARPALAALRENLKTLQLENEARVMGESVQRAVHRLLGEFQKSTLQADSTPPAFDLVFADPPYDDVDDALAALESIAVLFAPQARIILEHATRRPPRESLVFAVERERTYGDTTLRFLRLL